MQSSTIKSMLYDICDSVHSSCDSSCPVYRLNGNEVPTSPFDYDSCVCFKNGGAMLRFIEKKEKELNIE